MRELSKFKELKQPQKNRSREWKELSTWTTASSSVVVTHAMYWTTVWFINFVTAGNHAWVAAFGMLSQ